MVYVKVCGYCKWMYSCFSMLVNGFFCIEVLKLLFIMI